MWIGLRTLRLVQNAWSFTTDDAYVTLRYARHLFEGHGIVWNVGELIPVEGYSNFLFVLLGAAALRLGVDPVLLLKAVSCAAIAPTSVLLYILARRWLSPLAATLPPLLLTAFPGSVYWAVSGLETSVYQLFVVAAISTFIAGLEARSNEMGSTGNTADRPAWSRSRLHLLAAVFCLLAALTRPEGPVVFLVLAVTALLQATVQWFRGRRLGEESTQREGLRALLASARAFTFAFVIPYGVYFLWRVLHFGRLLPNTAYCKSTLSITGDPWTLIRDFWNDGKVFILLSLAQDPRKLGLRALPLFLLPIAYVGILFHADPIIGAQSRHFLAALAVLLVASSVGIANIAALTVLPCSLLGRALKRTVSTSSAAARERGARGPWPVLVDSAVVFGCIAWVAPPLDSMGPPPWLREPVGVRSPDAYARRMRARADLGRYLDQALSPEQSYLIGDAGIAPYLSHASVIDAFCLNSRELTTAPISFNRSRFIDWVFSRSPELLVVHSESPRRLVPRYEYGFYGALVADPRFRTLYRQTAAPIFGDGDFFYWIYERKPLTSAQN
jgi:hypothetical protein